MFFHSGSHTPPLWQDPRGLWFRRGNRKNGFLIGMTMPWRWNESSESAGREGSEQEGEKPGPNLQVMGFGGDEAGR